ncbi:MAG: hypothetical protein DYG90_00765 [Chloroflexi bacterium CFX6]|nr:hypothetical protein [Chloroflexi bacterium CFX6]
MVTDSRPETPEEAVSRHMHALATAIARMAPDDHRRASAALDAHAVAMLLRGECTALALHQAITVALAWATEMLPAREASSARVLTYRLRAVLDAEAHHLIPTRLQPAAADAASTGPDVLDQVRALVEDLLSDCGPDGRGRPADADADDTAPRGGFQ